MNANAHLVTGGGGFLGKAIVRRLVERGEKVRCFSRGDYPELRTWGIEVVRGDVADRRAAIDACRGCHTVFHVAAMAGVWGAYEEYHRANVVGTQNIIDGCQVHGVRKLIYTSSPSVVFNGTDMEGVDESVPYPRRFHAHYPRTKALAEQAVLAANGPNMATCALRPHLIWGPDDNHLVPRIVERGPKLRRIGSADKLVDSIYIDNAADAHILAADRLQVDSDSASTVRPEANAVHPKGRTLRGADPLLGAGGSVAGRAYFLSNGEPRGVWELINGILAAAGRPPVTRRVPKFAAMCAATAMEAGYKLLRLRGEPRLTRFVVGELTCAHWFDISAARRDLGYEPKVSIDEGLRRLREWFRTSQ